MQLAANQIKEQARRLGFEACGIAPAAAIPGEAARLDAWLAKGYEAGMSYLANHRALRLDPAELVPGARSIISVALNYFPAQRRDPSLPHIAYYAYGRDYHKVMKRKLRQLWESLGGGEEEARLFVDSAPVLERYWAWRAGLGWIGKNNCLILPGRGSFFFLGEIITTREVDAYDEPMPSRCGTCDRCLRACPSGALEAPHLLNANRCFSYLTIENRGEIPHELARKLGNRLYGCDTCQTVCPHNRFARPTDVAEFRPTEELLHLSKADLEKLTEEEYDRIFQSSAVRRAKYEGLMRNLRALYPTPPAEDTPQPPRS